MKERNFLGLPENWESELESLILHSRTTQTNQNGIIRQKAYICSPCRNNAVDGVLRNMRAARFYMYYAFKYLGLKTFAPHAYLPILLNDEAPDERSLALSFGKELLPVANKILVCGHELSDGMRGEITKAAELGMPITVYDPDLYSEISNIIGGDIALYDNKHLPLALCADELFEL